MTLLEQKLVELKQSKEVIDVYRDRLIERCLTGVLADYNAQFIVLSLISEYGEDNGISVVFVQDITRIRAGGNVMHSIVELSEHSQANLQAPEITLDSLHAMLTSIQMAYDYVNIRIEYVNPDICFVGEITEQDEDWISLVGYGTKESRDFNAMLIDKKQISRVDAGAKYEESIKYLLETKNQS